MPITVVYDDRPFVAESATAAGGALVLSLADLHAATGWDSKPEGLCRGDVCVPIPPARGGAMFPAEARFDLAEFARYLGQPVVHDDVANVWLFGTAAESRRARLRSLEAPDFTLPDLEGVRHSLSDHRGKKVLLLSWASW
jgi:hypothetical protein